MPAAQGIKRGQQRQPRADRSWPVAGVAEQGHHDPRPGSVRASIGYSMGALNALYAVEQVYLREQRDQHETNTEEALALGAGRRPSPAAVTQQLALPADRRSRMRRRRWASSSIRGRSAGLRT